MILKMKLYKDANKHLTRCSDICFSVLEKQLKTKEQQLANTEDLLKKTKDENDALGNKHYLITECKAT